MKVEIPSEIVEYFSSYKNKFNPSSKHTYHSGSNVAPIGELHWTVPLEVLWLYATDNEEDYEGSQTQFGVKKDGTVVWGYFSHCSCYGYEDYKGEVTELNDENEIHTRKTYELNEVDSNVLSIMKSNLAKMVEIGLKE